MKASGWFIGVFFVLLVFGGGSCINDDIDTSPGVSLAFSADTVNFGTVLTDLKTPTARLIVRNPHKKGVVISKISITESGNTFRFNVDGMSGKEFKDVEIRARDSIYIFLECFTPPVEGTSPVKIKGTLQFVTNGERQEVGLEAVAINAKRLHGLKVTQTMTLSPELPYVVFDSISVEKGATLRILPGTEILFHSGAHMAVRGTLEALGKPGEMIEMRGDRLDNVLPGVPYDLLSGQWKGIRIDKDSYGNRIEFTDMRSTSEGLRIDSCGMSRNKKLTLLNSWLHNSQTSVLTASNANIEAWGCCFSDSPEGVVRLTGGNVFMVQCTIANNYLFRVPSAPNLVLDRLSAADSDGTGVPPMKARFQNCIVYGMGQSLSHTDLSGTDVYMQNVLFKENGSDDANFISCIWDTDPMFRTDRKDYIFNYRLLPDSPALHAGNPEFVTPVCLRDIDGTDRLANGNPALGAYAE